MAAERWHGFRDLVDRVLDAFSDGRTRAFSLRPSLAVSSAEADRRRQLIGNTVPLLPEPSCPLRDGIRGSAQRRDPRPLGGLRSVPGDLWAA